MAGFHTGPGKMCVAHDTALALSHYWYRPLCGPHPPAGARTAPCEHYTPSPCSPVPHALRLQAHPPQHQDRQVPLTHGIDPAGQPPPVVYIVTWQPQCASEHTRMPPCHHTLQVAYGAHLRVMAYSLLISPDHDHAHKSHTFTPSTAPIIMLT